MSIQIQITVVGVPDVPLWKLHSKCLGMDPDFFYADGAGGVLAAKRVCNGGDDLGVCPVKDECLTHAMENDERFGVWGGTSERERRRLRSRGWRRRNDR